MRIHMLVSVLLAFTFLAAAGAQNVNDSRPAKVSITSATLGPDVPIGAGDLLEIGVYGAPEYRYEMRVDSRGDIALPLAGAIHVAGLNVSNAESAIARRLREAGAFNEPQVTVFEKEYATQGISVLGEVQKPGIYPLMGPRSLLDVLSAAGGTTARAGSVVSISHRGQAGPPEQGTINFDAQGNAITDLSVQPGDTVVVSRAGIVYVVGDVRDPAGIVMDKSEMTVLQAIAMAHGTNPTAKLSAAKLIRRSQAGTTQTPIPLDRILAARSQDIPVQADDIIFVPSSAAKSAARRGLEAIVQAATGMVIYRRP